MADDLEERVDRGIGNDERLSAREHLLDLGVVAEVDREIAQVLVVRRGDHVPHVPRLAHEDDRHAVDARHLGDALHDREEDAAEVEVRRESLRQLQNDLRVLFFTFELLHRAAQAKLAAEARDELDGARNGFLTKSSAPASNVNARAISSCASRRREDDDREVPRLGARAEDAEHLVAVGRRHDEIEEDDRRVYPCR